MAAEGWTLFPTVSQRLPAQGSGLSCCIEHMPSTWAGTLEAGDGNRTRMTSLEGVPHRAVTAPDLRIVVTGAASCWPVLTLANGALMARRS
jgi:hypothetical protein